MIYSNSFLLAVVGGMLGAAVTGMVMELLIMRPLYRREHLDQVLATFGLILFFNELVRSMPLTSKQ